ncbi:rhomboid family intramembrane serine protease [Alphaproteobacteria bacterium KMM 3653]|uniref:Rhomboid family intramembrane serine protease n=1 Tax=Harenicola maris TaxID=2841044 RepID=A0AAP2CP53_9RHOB|nr:rhomboid family intramembrane serine protease [Harenicola maris]
MYQDPNASPFNALPKAVIVLAAAIFAVELYFMAGQAGLIGNTRGGDDLRILAIQDYAFSGQLLDYMIRTGQFPAEHLLRFVTYPFVHFSFTSMIFAAVFVLALGKMVGEAFGNVAVCVIFFVASFVGALVYGLLLNDPRPLVGGFVGAYGLIGAYTFILWVGLGRTGQNQMQAFTLIGALCAYQLIFGVIFGASNDWVAEIAGFLTGGALPMVLSPGGRAALLAQIRRR